MLENQRAWANLATLATPLKERGHEQSQSRRGSSLKQATIRSTNEGIWHGLGKMARQTRSKSIGRDEEAKKAGSEGEVGGGERGRDESRRMQVKT